MASDIAKVNTTGAILIEVIRSIVKDPFIEIKFIDGEDVYELGQRSSYFSKSLRIEPLDQSLVHPDKHYDEVRVFNDSLPGCKYYLVRQTEEEFTEEVQKLARALEEYVKLL
jgi:hypothetical protein